MGETSLPAMPWPNDELAVANADSLYELIDQLSIIRECFELPMSEVAERMGVDKAAVSRIESGTTNPTVRTLRNYASAIGAYVVPIAVPRQEMPEWQRYLRSITEALELDPFIQAPEPVKRRKQVLAAKARNWAEPSPYSGTEVQESGSK